MDLNDMDQTQAIFLDEPDEDDGTDELLPEAEKQPKSFLKVLFQKGLTEKSYPLFEGENVIGRNADTCHVCIPSKALSKEHACIEINKDSHLIYDKGSRNKTKRGKLFLSPNVRYELKSDDEISLADIRCIYIKQTDDCILDGSETDGSESFLLQMDVSKEKNTSGLSPAKTSMFDLHVADKTVGGDDSPLQPTQTFAKENANKPALCVQETPEREYVEKLSTVVLSESESDDEEIVGQKRSSKPKSRTSTGSAVLFGDSDSSIDSEKFCLATQAYFPHSRDEKSADAPSPSDKSKAISSKRISDELTQVCVEEEATQACLADEPTQAFLQKDDGDSKNNNVVKPSAKNKGTEGTQSFDPKSEDVMAEKSDHDDGVLKSTQVFEEEEEEDENEDVAGLFAMSTMAPQEFQDEEEEDEDSAEDCDASNSKSIKQSTNDDATLPVSKNASEAPTQAPEETQKIEQKTENKNRKIPLKSNNKEDKTQAVTDTVVVFETVDINCSSANLSPGKSKFKKSTHEEPATFICREDETETDERGNGSKSTVSTLVFEDAETETQPYGNNSPIKSSKGGRKSLVHVIEDATQAYGDNDMETQQFEDEDNSKSEERSGGKDLVCNAEEPTQAYESDDIDSTQAFEQDKDGDDLTQTAVLDEPTQRVGLDEPTQKITFDEPTQKVIFDEPTQKITFDEPTQKISMDEPTQKFDFPEEKIPLAGNEEDSMSEDDSDIEEKSMLRSGDVLGNQATQVFDMKPASPQTVKDEIQPTMKYDMAVQEEATSSVKNISKEEAEVQPTLKYDMEVEEEATSSVKKISKQEEEVQPTLKYDMDVDEKGLNEDVSATAKKQGNSENPDKAASSSSATENECYSYPLSPCLEDIGKDGSDEDSDTPPLDVDVQPKSPYKPLPDRSPLKSALVDRKRSPSPSPKRVAFKETEVEITQNENVTKRSKRSLRVEISSGKGKAEDTAEEKKDKVNESSASKTGRRNSKAVKKLETADEVAKDVLKTAAEENVTATRRGRRKKGTIDTNEDKDGGEKEAEPFPSTDTKGGIGASIGKGKNVTEKTTGTSKKGRRNAEITQTETDTKESVSETLPSTNGKASEKTTKDGESDVVKESIGTTRRGNRKRGTIGKDEEKVEIEAETISSEKKSKADSEEPWPEKTSRGKAMKGQKASDFASKKTSASNDVEQSDGKSNKNKGKLPKSSRSNDQLDDEDTEVIKQLTGMASETNESTEEDNSTRRSGRRTVKNSIYKDFETGGLKKRESLPKPAQTRGKKRASEPVEVNKEDNDESKEIQKAVIDSDMGDFVVPAIVPTKRKRKIDEEKEDGENQSEPTQLGEDKPSSSKRSTRGKRGKPNKPVADCDDKEDMPTTTTSTPQQEGKPNKTRGRASGRVEKEKPPINEQDGQKDIKLKDVKDNETPLQKKGAGKRGAASKGQAKETPSQDTQKTDKLNAASATDETQLANVGRSNKRGRNSSKATGKESQQMPEASVPKGKRGASAVAASSSTAASEKEDDTPVIKGSQYSNRDKRKKPSSQEEDEISSTPSKRSRLSTASVTSSPVLRHSTTDSKPKVMFTGVIDEQGEKTVKELGGELVTNIHECTHLVTDKIRRTVKFLGGLAKGVLIVTQLWLDNSKRAGTFLDGQKYLVKDQEMEKQFKFNLANSIASSKKHPLLSGYQIHVSKSVKPDPTQMKDILLCAGADVLTKMPTKSGEKTVVVSCSSDEKLCKAAIKAGIPVVTAEFILTGILQQNINLEAYHLFQ